MRKKSDITPEDFNGLLDCLSSDPEEAGKKYEEIRRGLIKYFYFRGCCDPEALADETINRVTLKLPTARRDGNFAIASYFYSFASKIYLEELRQRKRIVAAGDQEIESLTAQNSLVEEKTNPGVVCMEKCLALHPPDARRLLLKYYAGAKGERVEERRTLAAERNLSIEGLHTKVSRLRKTLRECLKKCLHEDKG